MSTGKYIITCIVCDKKFNAVHPKQKMCSDDCRKQNYKEKTGRGAFVDIDIPANSVWKITEMMVAVELMKKGYTVFYALSPASYCDLIAVKANKILQIEARTGYVNKNGIFYFPTTIRGTANIYGVYERNNGSVHFFDKKRKEVAIN